MSSLEEKKTELERVLEVFQNYIERSRPCLKNKSCTIGRNM